MVILCVVIKCFSLIKDTLAVARKLSVLILWPEIFIEKWKAACSNPLEDTRNKRADSCDESRVGMEVEFVNEVLGEKN